MPTPGFKPTWVWLKSLEPYLPAILIHLVHWGYKSLNVQSQGQRHECLLSMRPDQRKPSLPDCSTPFHVSLQHHPFLISLWVYQCAYEAAQRGPYNSSFYINSLFGITWPSALTHLHLAIQLDPGIESKGQKWERRVFKVATHCYFLIRSGLFDFLLIKIIGFYLKLS